MILIIYELGAFVVNIYFILQFLTWLCLSTLSFVVLPMALGLLFNLAAVRPLQFIVQWALFPTNAAIVTTITQVEPVVQTAETAMVCCFILYINVC